MVLQANLESIHGSKVFSMATGNSAVPAVTIKTLGSCDYHDTFVAQREFTLNRTDETADEIWFLDHPKVFTQGQAGKAEHLLTPGDIPVVQSDRGGQVTYHGPGQLVVYFLIDLNRIGFGIKTLVRNLERAIVDVLAEFKIAAKAREDAPGVYTNDGAKIASLGLRVRNARTYHGIAINVDMDLEPFLRINPCGYQGLAMTRIINHADSDDPISVNSTATRLLPHLITRIYG